MQDEGRIPDIEVILAHIEHEPPPQTAQPEERRPRVKRRPHEIWERRNVMAALYAKGKTYKMIAEELGCSEQNVGQQINALLQEHRAEALKSIDEKIARVDAIISFIIVEAIDAWFESKEGTLVENTKRVNELRAALRKKEKPSKRAKPQKDDLDTLFDEAEEELAQSGEMYPASLKEESYTRTETSPGDARFLKLILECVEFQAHMHGLMERYKGQGSGLGGGTGNYAALTEAQRVEAIKNTLGVARLNKAKMLAAQASSGGEPIPVPQQQPVAQEVTRDDGR